MWEYAKATFSTISMIYSDHFAHLMEFLVGGTKMDCGENFIWSEKSVKVSDITETPLFFKGIYANNIENVRGSYHWLFMIKNWSPHYSDIIISYMASQITGVSIVYSTICSAADQRKHQSSASLAFVRGIHRWPVNSPHKGPVTWNMFPFDDVISRYCLSGIYINGLVQERRNSIANALELRLSGINLINMAFALWILLW